MLAISYHDKWHIDKTSPTGISYLPGPGLSKVTWGKPAQICQTKYDKECPCCSLSREDGYDMATDSAGECFGARCPSCEWTF